MLARARGDAMTAAALQIPPGVIRWGQLPVPYVAAWSSEQAIVIRRDALLGGRPAVFRDGGRGLGTPMFGKMSEERNRRVVLRAHCQVCNRPLRGAGYVFAPMVGHASGAPVVTEPLACEGCFRLSLAACPGIARLQSHPRALAARVRRFSPIMVTLRPAEGGDALLNHALASYAGPPPVGTLKIAVQDYDILAPAELGIAPRLANDSAARSGQEG